MTKTTNFKQAIIESTDGEKQVIEGQAFLGLTATPIGEVCECGKQHEQQVTAAMIGSFDMASMASMLSAAAHAFSAAAISENKSPFKIQALFDKAVEDGIKKAVRESMSESELEEMKEMDEAFSGLFEGLGDILEKVKARMQQEKEEVHVHAWEGSFQDLMNDEDIPQHIKEQVERQYREKVIPFERGNRIRD